MGNYALRWAVTNRHAAVLHRLTKPPFSCSLLDICNPYCSHSLLFCLWINNPARCRPTPGPGPSSSLAARTQSGRGLFRAP